MGKGGADHPGDPVATLARVSWPGDAHDEDPRERSRRPLPPDDRVWRHPSELGRFASDDAPAATGSGWPAPVSSRPALRASRSASSTLALSFVAGVLVGAGVLILVTASSHDRQVVVVERVMEAGGASEPTELAQGVLGSLVQVQVTTSGGRRVATGVFFRDDGHLLTTATAVADATELGAAFDDGRTLPAVLVGADPASDVAVLRVTGATGVPATLGLAGDLEAGERVIVASAGTASQAPVVTQGVVRTRGVTLTGPEGPLYGLLATSHPRGEVDPGGVLVDQRGAVVALATSRTGVPDVSVSGGGVLAVPIELARAVADDLVREGASDHPWLGVRATGVGAEAGASFLPAAVRAAGSSAVAGAEVVEVATGSPAQNAGLREGDVIRTVDGTSVGSMGELAVQVRRRAPGEVVQILYERDGAVSTSAATLAPWTEGAPGV